MDTSRSSPRRRIARLACAVGLVVGAVLVAAGLLGHAARAANTAADGKPARTAPATGARHDVCPPFHLLDEDGNRIDPVAGVNADRPFSPKQTCGRCHDYGKITQGYHFTQGRGEKPTPDQRSRCQWALTPGNYGGTWCSPAPLYKYLSPKRNTTARTMDMTSFTFLTVGCGACHPGGGSAEYDRQGKRYDRWMADPASGITPGGENNLDGDYYKARWSETGVLEADCLLCHLPEYDHETRKKHVMSLNFRWAPTAGAGFATVTGSIKTGRPVTVEYDKSLFRPDGKVEPHIIRAPRDEACLSCHAKPGWKKRGANFRARTDVHLRAGLACVDCHPSGSRAVDSRIRGKEIHQVGKGDDPGGHVRDDLDNTMRDCADCHSRGRHSSGHLGAPIAEHRWLPPLHLDSIACQTCHIPQRPVKAALVQAADVFNPGAKIPSKGKHLWTFYGPDGAYWNHYGDLTMMGYDDKPTDPFRPTLVRYNGKIYPANRVHTAWPAIEVEGRSALMQPKMGDIYKMWTTHHADPATYPKLAKVTDDNGDGVIEVNRPEEIDALIASVTEMLAATGYPTRGKRVLWVMDDRAYRSGTAFRRLPKHPWEASPYGNVHAYNHDVFPARAALGADGCTDCHHPDSPFFFAGVLKHRFDGSARPVTEPQYRLLDISGPWAKIGAWREAYLKPVLYALLAAMLCVAAGLAVRRAAESLLPPPRPRFLPRAVALAVAVALGATAGLSASQPGLAGYMLPTRFSLDANHFLIAVAIVLGGLFTLVLELGRRRADGTRRTGLAPLPLALLVALGAAGGSGILMLLRLRVLPAVTRASYTAFDLAITVILAVTLLAALKRTVTSPSA